MKLLNKISTYSLVTAGLAFTLSSSPVQAQVFTFGNATNASGGTATQRGQAFQVNTDTISGTTPTAPKTVSLQSIKFLTTSSNDVTPTANINNTAIRLYIYAALPTLTNLNAGTGALFANDIASTTAPLITLNDAAFVGNTVRESRTFTFSSPIELAVSTTYFALFSQDIGLATATGGITGGDAYRNITSTLTVQTGTDTRFITSATAVPFEFEASGGVAILGGLFLANKLRKRNQKVESEEQA